MIDWKCDILRVNGRRCGKKADYKSGGVAMCLFHWEKYLDRDGKYGQKYPAIQQGNLLIIDYPLGERIKFIKKNKKGGIEGRT